MSVRQRTRPGRPQKARQEYLPWLSLVLMSTLLFLSSCAPFSSPTQVQVTSTPAAKSKVIPTKPIPTSTPSSVVATPTQSPTDFYDEISLLHHLLSPQGWMWRVSLPADRLVIYYGNPFSSAMGPLGAYSDDELLAKLRQQTQAYADLDPQHPVIPAFDYVTPVAQASATADGTWTARMPDDSIEHYRELANTNHMLFFMDMQIAHSTVQSEVNNVWSFLQEPGVDLALDPEFDMPPGTTPGIEFGHMTAFEINWVIDKLSNLVFTQHLPPKILIIHQFRESMLPDWQNIRIKPGVEVVTSVDGFGTPEAKIGDYRIFDKQQLIQYPGFKLFYRWDQPLMSPSDVLKMDPPPLMVMYQ
jgi:hypothetical protein